MIQINGIQQNIAKIDNLAVNGLSGVSNSLAYKVHEIEKHFHNDERWYGSSGDISGANPCAKSVSDAGMPDMFYAISGNDTYGADANDEAFVWGLADTLSVGGVSQVKLDLHDIFITASTITTIWYLRVVYGTGTLADAIAAGQYSEVPVVADAAQNGSIDMILPFMMPRITIGTHKLWIQAKSTTDNATIGFLVGLHGYIA